MDSRFNLCAGRRAAACLAMLFALSALGAAPAQARLYKLFGVIPTPFVLLDDEGRGESSACDGFSYRLESYRVTEVTPTTVSFEFKAKRLVTNYNPAVAACPPPSSDLYFVGFYDASNRWAVEQLGYRDPDGKFVAKLSSLNKCTDNPWVGCCETCQKIGLTPVTAELPDPRPVTANLLGSAHKKELLEQLEARLVPQLVLPARNANLKDSKVVFQARAYLPTDSEHRGDALMKVQFERLVWPGTPGHKVVNHTAKLSNNGVVALVELEPGNWRMRLGESAGPWGSYRVFTIQEP